MGAREKLWKTLDEEEQERRRRKNVIRVFYPYQRVLYL
jgi:hypothetical protein